MDYFKDNKPTLIAVVTDAGLLPPNMRHTVEREYGHTYEKHGWITLRWETRPGGIAAEGEGDHTGVRTRTILVSMARALQAMGALARDELVA